MRKDLEIIEGLIEKTNEYLKVFKEKNKLWDMTGKLGYYVVANSALEVITALLIEIDYMIYSPMEIFDKKTLDHLNYEMNEIKKETKGYHESYKHALDGMFNCTI